LQHLLPQSKLICCVLQESFHASLCCKFAARASNARFVRFVGIILDFQTDVIHPCCQAFTEWTIWPKGPLLDRASQARDCAVFAKASNSLRFDTVNVSNFFGRDSVAAPQQPETRVSLSLAIVPSCYFWANEQEFNDIRELPHTESLVANWPFEIRRKRQLNAATWVRSSLSSDWRVWL